MTKEQTNFSVTIGICAPKESCFLCHESYDEAREAINTIRPLLEGGSGCLFGDEWVCTPFWPRMDADEQWGGA